MIEFNSIVVFNHGTAKAEFSGDVKLAVPLSDEQTNQIRQICWDAYETNKKQIAESILTSSQPLLADFSEMD